MSDMAFTFAAPNGVHYKVHNKSSFCILITELSWKKTFVYEIFYEPYHDLVLYYQHYGLLNNKFEVIARLKFSIYMHDFEQL